MKLRAYGDVFASCNQKAYQELVDFERLFVRAVMDNWRETSQKSIDLITRKHMFWAELMSQFADIGQLIDREAGKVEVPPAVEK